MNKKLFQLSLLFQIFILSCSVKNNCDQLDLKEELNNDGWVYYLNSQTINIENANCFDKYDSSDPESMIQYLFASLIAKKENWKDILDLESQTFEKFKRPLNKYPKWTFKEVKLIKKQKYHESGLENLWLFELNLKIEINGETTNDSDQVAMIKNDEEKWIFFNLPN